MIDLHSDESPATAALLFGNAEWNVLPEGLEHRASGYFIARDVLGMRRGDLWEWPLHLAEKSWCQPLPFRDAFLAALETFTIARDAGLAASFALGFGLTAGQGLGRSTDGFVSLGEIIRPKAQKQSAARKRNAAPEVRGSRRGMPVPRTVEAGVQRIAL
ncbi:hypothetical protein [Methylobacterium sp. J-090]|uniref:hypothetical protein n=1 Tax=Methylobacterium sp. J-090 TaxID=2836666 RepID=UPI001FBA864E|nr:hypothetical protein [Methylobacterium sp. J-090]MCJ2082909.1 hypothetical protein [Methylobacterium sp. J-090]